MENNDDPADLPKSKVHFVLVHGLCMGAWCWYKLKTLLENEGYKVTVPDLLASGVDETNIDDVNTFSDYNNPLWNVIETLPPFEKAILVGNCLGGLSIAMAADRYPKKVIATVFLGAFVPDTKNAPSYVVQKFLEWVPPEFWMDTKYPERAWQTKTLVLIGPEFLKSNIFNHSPKEDALLAGMLVRPSSLFVEDLSTLRPFTDDGYGSVKRVVIMTKDGAKAVTEEFNKWQMGNAGITESETIEEADDMAMISKPQEVLQILLKIAASC